MKKIGHIGPFSRTHAIRVPTYPESCIFVDILGDIMIVTPPPWSSHFPCLFRPVSADVIQSFEGSIIFCLFRNSVKPKTSLPRDSLNFILKNGGLAGPVTGTAGNRPGSVGRGSQCEFL